jgi:hypothetical protein
LTRFFFAVYQHFLTLGFDAHGDDHMTGGSQETIHHGSFMRGEGSPARPTVIAPAALGN